MHHLIRIKWLNKKKSLVALNLTEFIINRKYAKADIYEMKKNFSILLLKLASSQIQLDTNSTKVYIFLSI